MFLLFPTSLCGVLVFRLDPAGAPPPLRLRLLLRRRLLLTHSSLTHSLIHPTSLSLTHSLRRLLLTHSSLSHSHSLTDSLTTSHLLSLIIHRLASSLTHSLTHSLTQSLSLTHYFSPLPHHSPLFTTPLITSHSSFTTFHYTTYHVSLLIPHPSLFTCCLSCGRRSAETFLAAFRVAGAVHRAS